MFCTSFGSSPRRVFLSTLLAGVAAAGIMVADAPDVHAQALFSYPKTGVSGTYKAPTSSYGAPLVDQTPTRTQTSAARPVLSAVSLQPPAGTLPQAQKPELIPPPAKDEAPAPAETAAECDGCDGKPPADNFLIKANYKYNAGGGYLSIWSPETDFTVNLQNQVTLDGTFHDRNVSTIEQGFNIPFYRTYLYGNVTKNIDYQISVQGFLGQFNVLDLWGNFRYDDRLNLRVGRMLSPLLYEYYGWSPAWEPVITNSVLFQFASKRQEGAMLWGRLAENKFQYQAGVFNGVPGAFFGIGRDVAFIGSFDTTPFKKVNDTLDSLGIGCGVETGWQNIPFTAASTGGASFINGAGEPTLNSVLVTSTGVPWLTYLSSVSSVGNMNKVTPHFFYYNRFSVVAEYLFMNRFLDNTATGVAGNSTIHGWYVNASYFLTGERYRGDGLGGYTTIEPLSPFKPFKGCWGPGAWEVASQYSQVAVSGADLTRFADPTVANSNRIDQIMIGMNWWPNKYTRWSFDWMHNNFNNPISPTGKGGPVTNELAVWWMRLAMFF